MRTMTMPQYPPLRVDPALAEAREALRDDEAAALALERRRSALATGATVASPRGLYADLQDLAVEQATLDRQITTHRAAVDTCAREWSARVCEELRTEHRALVRRIAAGVRTLDAALGEERAFRERLTAAGVMFAAHLRPMPLDHANLGDPHSPASAWMRDAYDYELLGE